MVQSEIAADAGVVLERVVKVSETAGWSVKKLDVAAKTAEIKVPMSMMTYGLRLKVAVEPLGNQRSVLRVDARRVVPTEMTSNPEEVASRFVNRVSMECNEEGAGPEATRAELPTKRQAWRSWRGWPGETRVGRFLRLSGTACNLIFLILFPTPIIASLLITGKPYDMMTDAVTQYAPLLLVVFIYGVVAMMTSYMQWLRSNDALYP